MIAFVIERCIIFYVDTQFFIVGYRKERVTHFMEFKEYIK